MIARAPIFARGYLSRTGSDLLHHMVRGRTSTHVLVARRWTTATTSHAATSRPSRTVGSASGGMWTIAVMHDDRSCAGASSARASSTHSAAQPATSGGSTSGSRAGRAGGGSAGGRARGATHLRRDRHGDAHGVTGPVGRAIHPDDGSGSAAQCEGHGRSAAWRTGSRESSSPAGSRSGRRSAFGRRRAAGRAGRRRDRVAHRRGDHLRRQRGQHERRRPAPRPSPRRRRGPRPRRWRSARRPCHAGGARPRDEPRLALVQPRVRSRGRRASCSRASPRAPALPASMRSVVRA